MNFRFIIICSYKFMHANLEIHHHNNNIIVCQTTLKPRTSRTHVIKTMSELPFFTMEGKGQIYYFGVQWSSWERRLGAGKHLRWWVWGGRISRLFVGRRMDCVANSVVAALTNKRYYSSRRWPQRSCINSSINSRVSKKNFDIFNLSILRS